MSWENVKLEDLCISITDGDHQSLPLAEEGIPFIVIADINSNNRIEFKNARYVPRDYYEKLDDKRKPRKGDVLLTVKGSFGIPVYVAEDNPFVFQRDIAILKCNQKINPRFLYYYMKNREFYLYTDSIAIGAAQRAITLKALRNTVIKLPPLDTQQGVVDLLSAYDDLIENSQKQIKLLEEVAQRLYKEWFVDLRFPGHETTPVTDGIPEGWNLTNINAVMTFHRGYDLTKNNMIHGKYPVVGSTSIIGYHNQYKVHGPGIITGRSGSLGEYQLIWEDYWPHNTSLYVSDMKDHHVLYLYSMLQTVDFSGLNNGGAIPTLNRNTLSNIPVVEAPKALQNEYVQIVEPVYSAIRNTKKQIKYLQEARDRLLPKLMNGEIEV